MMRLWCGALIAAMGFGGVALAAEPQKQPQQPSASDRDREQADALFHQGNAALYEADWPRAQKLFRASFDLLPRGTALGNLGVAEVHAGSLVEGLAHIREALARADLVGAKRAVVEKAYADAYGQTGHIAIKTEDGASVWVDGVEVPGKAPFPDPIDVLPGTRAIQAKVVGRSAERSVEAPAGTVVDLEVALPPPPEVTPGLTVPREPAVRADESYVPGAHRSWWTAPRIVGVAAGAGAVAALGVGIYFHEAAVNTEDDIAGLRANQLSQGQCAINRAAAGCSTLVSKRNALGSDNAATNVSLAVGGAFAVGSVIAFVLGTRSPDARSASSIRPWIGVGSFGLDGSF